MRGGQGPPRFNVPPSLLIDEILLLTEITAPMYSLKNEIKITKKEEKKDKNIFFKM